MPSNLERKARRQTQTRLTFAPLDVETSSSPSMTTRSAARVRYHHPATTPTQVHRSPVVHDDADDSDDILASSHRYNTRLIKTPSKKNVDGKLPFKKLPTPAKSSQTTTKVDNSFDETFDSESDEEYDKLPLKPLPTPVKSSQVQDTVELTIEISDDEGDSDVNPRATKRKRPNQSDVFKAKSKVSSSVGRFRGKHAGLTLDGVGDSSSDSSRGSPAEDSPKTPLKKKKQMGVTKPNQGSSASKFPSGSARRQKSISLSNDSVDDMTLPAQGSIHNRGNRVNNTQAAITLDSDESNSLKPVATSSQRRVRKIMVPEDGDGDHAPAIGIKSSHHMRARGKRQLHNETPLPDDSVEIVPRSALRASRTLLPQNDDEDSDQPVFSPMKRRRQVIDEAEDSDEDVSPPKRSRQVADEEEEEEEDDSDLPSLSNISSSREKGKRKLEKTPTRQTRQSKVKKHRTLKQKSMELLRRKRAGENIDKLTDSESAGDTDSDLQVLSEFEDESEDELTTKVRHSTHTTNIEDNESDFIVDDDDVPLGVPHHGILDIPLQFTHAAHKPLKEHFKDAVEWMVQNKINPAFSRNDPVYNQAFAKLDNEYRGFASSKFVSSSWTDEFTRAVYARPTFMVQPLASGEGLNAQGEVKCDACNHRKHQPAFIIQFQGKPYHKQTLEELEEDSEDEDSDAATINSQGQTLPDQGKEWYVGRFCKGNAEQAHSLIHWKYALNIWVVDSLENEGYLTPEKLAERAKMKAKERRISANTIVDEWEAQGALKTLYKDFKTNLDTARDSKQGRWK